MAEKNRDNHYSDLKQRGQLFMSLYSVDVQRRLYRYVYSLFPDESLVDDIIQETVSYMWERFDEFREGTNFLAWALTIAKYRVLDQIKQAKRDKRLFSDSTLQSLEQLSLRRIQNDDDRHLDRLRCCIKKLPPRDRHLLTLRYEVNSTLKSMSENIGLSVNSIYNRLYRIRVMLFNCVRNDMD
ncbi:MAG: sigma-70 family RNA polymerase sigma factor [Phycisphaerae bacterium]|jgi:RNA polymerase sigma-70 factor (ECF subfamily)